MTAFAKFQDADKFYIPSASLVVGIRVGIDYSDTTNPFLALSRLKSAQISSQRSMALAIQRRTRHPVG
ncbi:hypothetical protein [Pseudomonas fluorescens]|uniref:hypothetical protein n=1 Tax=Pseudomonas fluorescens TaxID=294 RepID=UPI0012406C8A|nr:hypothetical protein [Pseudomonas fluorescens]VVM74860.1 hypothetical protein PS639_01969 [Pseudomonas fluorescens]